MSAPHGSNRGRETRRLRRRGVRAAAPPHRHTAVQLPCEADPEGSRPRPAPRARLLASKGLISRTAVECLAETEIQVLSYHMGDPRCGRPLANPRYNVPQVPRPAHARAPALHRLAAPGAKGPVPKSCRAVHRCSGGRAWLGPSRVGPGWIAPGACNVLLALMLPCIQLC